MRLVPAIAILSMAAAAFGQSAFGGRAWNPRDQIDFSPLQTGIVSRISTQGMQVLATEGDLQAYWARSTGQAPQTAPRVDWLRNIAVAINLGERPSAGYTVYVQSVERRGAATIIHAIERTPMRGGSRGDMKTSPFVIIQLARNAGNPQLDLQRSDPSRLPGGGEIILTDPYGGYGGGGYGYEDEPRDCDWDVYDSGVIGGIQQSGVFSIDSMTQWHLYYSRLTGQPPHKAPDNVDWMKYRLVAVHLGSRPTGGYRARVTRVVPNGLTGIISITEMKPRDGAMVTQAATSPWVLVRVPRNLTQFRLDYRAH